jgi:hypothetical protein
MRQRQENREFTASLSYIVRLLKTQGLGMYH